jgi:poly(3-hydroxybutyrate) depolymerase
VRRQLAVADAVDFWVGHNRCPVQPRREVLVGGAIARETYGPCAGDSRVVVYTLRDGGHDWPGAWPRWWRRPPHGFAATEVIGEFFARHATGKAGERFGLPDR